MRPDHLVAPLALVFGTFACGLSDLPEPPSRPQQDAGSQGPGSGGAGGASTQGTGGQVSGGSGGVAGSNAGGAAGGESSDGAAIADAPASSDAGADAMLVTCAGRGLQLDGTGYLQTNRLVQDDFTLEAWIQTTASLTGSNFFEGNGLIYADLPDVANDFGLSILNDRLAFGVGNPDTTILSFSAVTTG